MLSTAIVDSVAFVHFVLVLVAADLAQVITTMVLRLASLAPLGEATCRRQEVRGRGSRRGLDLCRGVGHLGRA